WLYVMARLGYDKIDDRHEGETPSGTNYEINAQGQSGDINISTTEQTELNLDGIIGVTHKLTTDINLDATLGGNIRKNRYESVGVSGGPFVIPELYTPSNVVNYGRSYDFNSKEVHSGYYSLDFSYKDYLTLSTTGRYDAYSTLYYSGIPKDKRDIFTPSVSASLLFSQLLNIPKLNFGKLRASYAQTSGEPSSPYQTATYYSVGNAINGTPTGSFSGTLPNLFLKPFTVTEVEVGTELKFFQSRLGFDIAWYTRKTKNEIMNGNLSWATGYSSYVVANGSVQNKGLEILVTGKPVATRNFEWNISVNATTVSNKILQTDLNGNNLGQGTYRPLNATTAFVKGLSGPQIMAYDYQRDSKGDLVVDGSGLPLANGAQTPQGSVLPTFYGGVKNDFSYKNFNLSFLIDYNYGNKILSATKFYAVYRGLDKSTLAGRDGGISVTGVDGSGNPVTTNVSAQAYYQRIAAISKTNVLNGDFIKLRQVTLGYTIPEKAFAKVPVIRSIQLSLVGRNLAILMKKTDNIDPEAEFNAGINYAGIEGTSLPGTRTFGINANIKFKN
ncbi:MAG: TonB-dependent receptor domain-containing protein, partial [Ginsengibacter sp.]